ncbi:MAG: polyprenyl synthetase family protein [Patescibacteria group bacterium]
MSSFKERLLDYKKLIDSDIEVYASHIRRTTREQYGESAGVVTEAYLDMLAHGGKRIRGALAMVGYEMCGGKDREMIVRAATAIEMTHAYILIIDDIQDRSTLRRGQPTVHETLAAYHRAHSLRGSADHTGISLALNAALTGAHAAQMLFAGLSVDAELRLKVLGIVNHTMIITAHGQTSDIMNECTAKVATADVEHAMELKTAHYTILNPLCVGMVLAGAGCEGTDAIRDYAIHAGKAFQITDDIIGVFGDDKQTGKNTMDDIREGKRTLLTVYALEHAATADRHFLLASLGNEELTKADFLKCQQIIKKSGAPEQSLAEAHNHIEKALKALDIQKGRWSSEGVAFLNQLAQSLLERSS